MLGRTLYVGVKASPHTKFGELLRQQLTLQNKSLITGLCNTS